MIRKFIAAATVGGVLALGGVGAASAAATAPSTPTAPASPTASTFTCAKAPAALAKIATLESKVAQRETTLKSDLTQATSAGHTTVVAKINHRLARLARADHRLGTLTQLVQMACPGVSASPTSQG